MKPFTIRSITLAVAGLLMLSTGAAQTPEEDAVAMKERQAELEIAREEVAEDAVAMEALRAELEIAREEVATAAQRLARLQRELVEIEGGAGNWLLKHAGGDIEDIVLDLNLNDMDNRLRQITFAAFPPRLGVLLDGSGADDTNLIVGVTPGSGAEEAGLREGDRLIEVNGEDVRADTGRRVRDILAAVESGDSVDVLVARDDGDTEIIVPVTVRSSVSDLRFMSERMAPALERIEREIIRVHPTAPDAPVPPPAPRPPHLAGLGHDTDLMTNHSGLASYFGTDAGVVVLRIADDNPLYLEPGDVILSIDGESVQRPVDLGRILLNRDPGDDITLEVMRQGLRTELYGTIPERGIHRFGGRVGLAPPRIPGAF